MSWKIPDFASMAGMQFGHLTLTGRSDRRIRPDKGSVRLAEVVCCCGKQWFIVWQRVKEGSTKSCGCQSHLKVRIGRPNHNMRNTNLHGVWSCMKNRCSNPRCKYYPSYGGRGIGFCEEWNLFDNFAEWALSNGYAKGLSIDRIDNNGSYCPDNCRWATRREQSNNRRVTLYLEAFGEVKSAKEWTRDARCTIPYGTLLGRISRGYAHEIAIGTPSRRHKNHSHTMEIEARLQEKDEKAALWLPGGVN